MGKFLLRQKLLLSLALVSLFCLLTIGTAVFISVQSLLLNYNKAEILSLAKEQVNETTLEFKINRLFVHLLSRQTQVKEFLVSETKRAEVLNIFSGYANDEKKYLAIYLLDKNGVGLVSTDPRFVGQDYSFRDYFKKALKGEASIDVAVGKTTNQFGYYFAEPVIGTNNEILGVVVAKIDETSISGPLLSGEISKNSVLMLADEFGVVIASSEADRNLKSLSKLSDQQISILQANERYLGKAIVPLQYDFIEQAIRGYKAPVTTDFNDVDDNERETVSLIKVNDFPFYLVVESRLSRLDSQVFRTTAFIAGIVLLILILMSALLFYFLKKVYAPLDKFSAFFANISNGDYSQKISIQTRDEFYDMAISANQMTKNLSDLYTKLDEKVKDQTIEINKKVEESKNQNRAIINILEDVQLKEKKAESLAKDLAKFKLAVDNASDQVVITDPEGMVVYGNAAIERITGYTPEEALGKKAGSLWKMPMPQGYYENMWDVIKKQKKVFISDIQNKRKDGTIYVARISISPVLDKDSNIIYFVALERDITLDKEIDKAKTEFVSLASHQLRTPLSSINWYTEMLLAGDAGEINEEQKKYLTEVAIGNQRMVELVNALLNVSRLDLGTFIIEPEVADVVEIGKSVVDELKPEISKKKLTVEQLHGENLPEFKADKKLLRIVLQNLLSNAVKYTPQEGRITIGTSVLRKEDLFGGVRMPADSLGITVTDSGMGIPSDQKDRIFSKMFRADNAREAETEGTGLGLYIIKSIIDQSDGNVWFESEVGKGTTFYVIFPLSGMKKKEGSKILD